MIQLQQVFKNYGQQVALNGVNLHIPKGQCTVLLGPSGCGKSTLLKTINRLVEIDQGSVLFNQLPVANYDDFDLRRQIGYCIQGVGLFPHMTVYENIAVVPRLLKWDQQRIKIRVDELMTIGELPKGFLSKKPGSLSGGEAQRVGVLRALAADPPVLLMDEPFGAVDPLTREKLQRAFLHIQSGLKKTVVFVTHDIEEAVLLADKIAIMQSGSILQINTPHELFKNMGAENLEKVGERHFVNQFLGMEFGLSLLKRFSSVDVYEKLMGASHPSTHPSTHPLTLNPEHPRYNVQVSSELSAKALFALLLQCEQNDMQLVLCGSDYDFCLQKSDILSFLEWPLGVNEYENK